MRLVPIETTTAPTTVPAYSCPMHPEITSDKPGKCPKCGMDLVATGAATSSHSDAGHAPAEAATGHAVVHISSEGLKLAGLQTAPATRERLARTIRAVGTVTPDETRIRHVHTKIPGWVEELYVNFTGQFVTKGQPILSIYSQELLATQEEYLGARQTALRFASSELPEVRKGGEDLVRAARRRLELYDVPESSITQLESTGKVERTVTLNAPVSGFVTMKDVFEGQQVDPAMELFTIADLSRVWVEADFYEYEARALRLGAEAAVTLPYDTGTRLAGRIAFISPTLDADTRTLKVRFEFANSGMTLKPGMFANVELETEAVEGIMIPDSALMDTGERQVAFVARGGGTFEPREVQVGTRAGGKAQILAGVAEGEEVVIRANFLLDSESRLRAAISGIGAGGHEHGAGP
jgi:RND family efflux transporter MFP subunit